MYEPRMWNCTRLVRPQWSHAHVGVVVDMENGDFPPPPHTHRGQDAALTRVGRVRPRDRLPDYCSRFVNTRQIWSIEEPEWTCKIDEGSAGLAEVHWSPDGRHVLTTSDFHVGRSFRPFCGVQKKIHSPLVTSRSPLWTVSSLQLRITVWSLTNKSVSYIKYPKACEKGLWQVNTKKCGFCAVCVHRTECTWRLPRFFNRQMYHLTFAGLDFSCGGKYLALAERRDCKDYISVFECASWHLVKVRLFVSSFRRATIALDESFRFVGFVRFVLFDNLWSVAEKYFCDILALWDGHWRSVWHPVVPWRPSPLRLGVSFASTAFHLQWISSCCNLFHLGATKN